MPLEASTSRNGIATRNGVGSLLLFVILATPLTLFAPLAARADADTPGKVIAGWVEKIVLLPWSLTVPAKLDSGAFTSSVHGENVERFEKDDEPWVRFTLVVKDEDDKVRRIDVETPVTRRVRIKRQEEDPDARPVIDLDFCMDGRRHRAQFSIAPRDGFNYSVLLGRRFLEERFVIDPESTFLTQGSCGETDLERKDDS